MSAKYFEVDTDQLGRDTTELAESIEESQRCLKEMESGIASLSTTWDGTAKATFMVQFEKDSAFFSDFLNELITYAEDLRAATQEYNACENEVMMTVRAIRI